jgi:hypothetical protein
VISKLGVPDTFLEKHSSPQQTEQKHNLNVFLTRKTTRKDIQRSNNNNYLMMERIINNKYTFISVETLVSPSAPAFLFNPFDFLAPIEFHSILFINRLTLSLPHNGYYINTSWHYIWYILCSLITIYASKPLLVDY